MKESDILNDVLWLAIEDASGLWEILWDLKPKYPTVSEEKILKVASRAVRELLGRNWVEFYSCREPDGELKALTRSGVDSVLADMKNWKEPEPGEISIRISATDAGRKALAG